MMGCELGNWSSQHHFLFQTAATRGTNIEKDKVQGEGDLAFCPILISQLQPPKTTIKLCQCFCPSMFNGKMGKEEPCMLPEFFGSSG